MERLVQRRPMVTLAKIEIRWRFLKTTLFQFGLIWRGEYGCVRIDSRLCPVTPVLGELAFAAGKVQLFEGLFHLLFSGTNAR